MKVQALKADFPLPVLLQITGLARSPFFYHQARLQALDPREKLKAKFIEIFEKNHGWYGHRCVHTKLVKQGWTIAKKDGAEADAFLAARLQSPAEEALQLLQG